ncbi:DUF1636 domain-containing protein [Roseateles sp. GG27B]
MKRTELIISPPTRPAGAAPELPAAGLLLLQAVQDAQALQSFEASDVSTDTASAAAADFDAGIQVRGIACLSACNRACTIALQAAGKHTYCFGDLLPDAETAEHLLACARLHQHSADGTLLRKDRPARLRSGILVRLPPFAATATATTTTTTTTPTAAVAEQLA